MILLAIILTALYFIARVGWDRYYYKTNKWVTRSDYSISEDVFGWLILTVLATVVVVSLPYALVLNSGIHTYHETRAVLEESNAKIEKEVALYVDNFQEYEKDTHKNVTAETILAYPELASSELVREKAQIYVRNQETMAQKDIEYIQGKELVKRILWKIF